MPVAQGCNCRRVWARGRPRTLIQRLLLLLVLFLLLPVLVAMPLVLLLLLLVALLLPVLVVPPLCGETKCHLAPSAQWTLS